MLVLDVIFISFSLYLAYGGYVNISIVEKKQIHRASNSNAFLTELAILFGLWYKNRLFFFSS